MATATGSYATAALIKARAGITDSGDDALIGTIADDVNQYIESTTKRILAPITSAQYTFDGDGSGKLDVTETADGTLIGGIRAITALEMQRYTGAGYETVATSDVFLRGRSLPAAPYDWLLMSDYPAGSFYCFPKGFATVRITATAGWAAIPDDITGVALTAAVRAWHAREAGQQDIVGTDEFGRPIVSRFFSARDLGTLRRYTRGKDL